MESFIDLTGWMGYLDDNLKVINTNIPGSHDASAYQFGNALLDVANDLVGAITQAGSYADQLAAGSRYFDMRIMAGPIIKSTLVMHHGIMPFDDLDTVLDEIKNFMLFNPNEFIFMDLDFEDTGLQEQIKTALIKKFTVDKFVTQHWTLSEDGLEKVYNEKLTWGDLRKDSAKRLIVMWPAYPGMNSNVDWAPSADIIRYNWDGDFENMSPADIVTALQTQLNGWTKDKLWVTQLINTPKFSPTNHPDSEEREATPYFNGWITTKKMEGNNTPKLGVVKRDFVTWPENALAVQRVLRLNNFNKQPFVETGRAIFQYGTSKIRLRAPNTLWVSLQTTTDGQHNYLKLIKTPDATCDFLMRERGYHTTGDVNFSGNIKADRPGDHGNVRLVPRGDTCLSVDRSNGNRIYYGVGWGPADNLESVLFYNPHHLTDTGPMRDGMMVFVRSFIDRLFWKVNIDAEGDMVLAATGQPESYDATMFTVYTSDSKYAPK